MKKNIYKHVFDLLGIPFRLVLLPDKCCEKLGLTSLEEERIYTVIPHIRGRLLDIGCGNNRLVHEYEQGTGVDVYKWSMDILLVDDSASIPLKNNTFDTITFLACLNHIPNRRDAIKEAHRLLKDKGRIIITMINPLLGTIGHKIWWYGEDRKRGMQRGEKYGLWNKGVIKLFEDNGFSLRFHKRFVYGMNNLFVFKKR